MNFLQLVQRFHTEASMAGAAPSTVVGQTGEAARAVNWIETAYEDIQSSNPDWKFLREDFSFPTVSGTSVYPSTTETDLSSWITDDLRVYLAETDETELIYLAWPDFKVGCLFGSSRSQTGKPYMVSVNPDEALVLWPIPDAIYTVNGSYRKTAQAMTVDASVPILPAQFHMAIVWRALMFYGAFENAPEVYSHAINEYNRILSRMEINQLPEIVWGAPLA